MKTIVLASTNPVKAWAVQEAFQRMFPQEIFHSILVDAPSGVRSQPLTDTETLQGAEQRARTATIQHPGADYWVGIEGGVEDTEQGMAAFAWVVILSNGLMGRGRTGTFYLPEAVAALIRTGKELGEADDLIFQQSNSKQKNGAIGLLTGNVVNRSQLYEHAVILALVPFKNPAIYTP
jgi:inosine/xanthosine triphosphatase